MKFVVLACLAAVALARPQNNDLGSSPILRDDRIDDSAGTFSYAYETGNGIEASAQGTPGIEGQSNIAGTYRFPFGDGKFLEVTYEADERGFRPSTRLVSSRK